jgi:hypothetical protein
MKTITFHRNLSTGQGDASGTIEYPLSDFDEESLELLVRRGRITQEDFREEIERRSADRTQEEG